MLFDGTGDESKVKGSYFTLSTGAIKCSGVGYDSTNFYALYTDQSNQKVYIA